MSENKRLNNQQCQGVRIFRVTKMELPWAPLTETCWCIPGPPISVGGVSVRGDGPITQANSLDLGVSIKGGHSTKKSYQERKKTKWDEIYHAKNEEHEKKIKQVEPPIFPKQKIYCISNVWKLIFWHRASKNNMCFLSLRKRLFFLLLGVNILYLVVFPYKWSKWHIWNFEEEYIQIKPGWMMKIKYKKSTSPGKYVRRGGNSEKSGETNAFAKLFAFSRSNTPCAPCFARYFIFLPDIHIISKHFNYFFDLPEISGGSFSDLLGMEFSQPGWNMLCSTQFVVFFCKFFLWSDCCFPRKPVCKKNSLLTSTAEEICFTEY